MTRREQTSSAGSALLRETAVQCRFAFVAVGLLTALVNILMLTGSVYMLQVYDRVLPSRSVPTLVVLSIALLGVYALLGTFDWARQRILARIGVMLDQALSGPVLAGILRVTTRGQDNVGLQPSRDLDTVRSFLSSLGPTALFDLPWVPLYLWLCFLLHPLLGWTLVVGAVILMAMTALTELRTRGPAKDVIRAGMQRAASLEAARRNAEIVTALGMERRVVGRFAERNSEYVLAHQRTSDVVLSIGTASKMLRFVLQSATLGVGAWLVIQDQASGGVMIAASILSGRALAPIELAISQWKPFSAARSAWRRLSEMLATVAGEEPVIAPSVARTKLTVESLFVGAPGAGLPILQGVSFAVDAGRALGVIGPSASGKSTLARALVGVWPAVRGEIRLDGATLDQWPAEMRGAMIGYLPQDIELFDGTVAENISRFDPEPTSEAIQAAAETAGAHEMILRLPKGYETRIGEAGGSLSGGQRQRIALGRALYKDPFLVVLDEPNSNLDAEGEAALTRAIHAVRQRGGIAVVIAHRPSALAGVDLVLALLNGQPQAFGPRDDVLRKVLAPREAAPKQGAPLHAVAGKSVANHA